MDAFRNLPALIRQNGNIALSEAWRLSASPLWQRRGLEGAPLTQSLVLFTGTPHRGKDYGFLALLQLVRKDLFDPEKDMHEQLSKLHQAMIRNNKALVTDLQGNKLFQPVATEPVDYSYSAVEANFTEQ